MKRYTYQVKLSVNIMADNETDAEDVLERILPSDVDVDLIDLEDVEEISFDDYVADMEYDRRKCNG